MSLIDFSMEHFKNAYWFLVFIEICAFPSNSPMFPLKKKKNLKSFMHF